MTITPTDVHKLLRGILYPIDLSGGSSSASSAHLDSDWSDGASVRTNVTASTTASSSAASQGTPGQSAKFSRFLAPPARTGKKARPPRAQVRPSADSAMLAEHTKNVLKLEGSQFESLKRNIVETHSTQATALDITIYLFLLERNLGFWRPDDLPGPTVYGEWKQLERSDIQKMVSICHSPQMGISAINASSPAFPDDAILITLCIREAMNLLPKDPNGSSNPYCTISMADVAYISPSVTSNLNPRWEFEVPLILHANTHDEIIISVWNRSSNIAKDRRSDAFLGMITVLPSELLKACDTGPSEQRRPLGKRSSRSHVSGTISVAAQRVCLNDPPSRTYEKIFATIPSDPQATFKILVKKCLDYDLEISSGQALLSEKSRALLDTVATTWRITVPFRNMVYFEALTALFSRGVITATALLEAGLSKANEIAVSSRHLSIPEVKLFRAACSVALPLLKHQLSTFLNHPLTTLHAQQLDAIITMMVSIQGNPTIDMGNADMAGTAKQVIVVALEARYHGLHAIAHSNQNARFAGLINLVQATREELELYRRHLSKKYFGFICIPDLAAEVFFHKLKPELDTFSKVYFASSSDLGDAFDLYKQVQSLIEVYDKMNYELAERFTVEDWFTPFLREWTLVTGRKFDEWMQRAISLDDFSFSDTTPYSTSVVDMFSSFQQQIEFILGLKWPNQAQEDAVLKCLIKDIALTLESYTHAMVKKMDEDFRTVGHTSSVVPPKSQSKDKRRKKMKIKLGKSKKLPDIDSCEIRVPQKACVKLNNIHALPELFAELCGRFSGIWPDHRPSCDIPNAPPAVPPKSRRHATPSRIPIRVTVLRGHRLQPTRPSTTLISCRLRCGNRTLGETTAVGQSPDASWETPCYFALGESEMPLPLEICLMHHMPDPSFAENAAKVFMFARGTTAVNWFSASGQEVLVDLGPSCGGIRVKCENMSDDETAFAKGLVESSVEHALHDGTLRLSDHVYNDLSARLKAVSKKYKRAALKKFLTKLGPKEKENSPPLGHTRKAGAAVAPSDEEIEQDLAPILSYINVNLEVLTENMEHELALVVAGHVWDRIVSGLETLVVGPSSNEEGKEHIGLDERRAQAVKKVANLLALFFHSDGEGLHEGRLLTPSFQQLLRLLDPSLRNEKDIIRRWEAAKAMDSLDSAIEDEGTPQLLRIRTSKELVDSSGARPPSGT